MVEGEEEGDVVYEGLSDVPEGEGQDEFYHENSILIHFVHVGFGDCILIQSKDKNILVDCRHDFLSNEDYIINYLTYWGVENLDLFIITHGHNDHFNGFQRIVSSFGLGKENIWISPYIGAPNKFYRSLYTRNLATKVGGSGGTNRISINTPHTYGNLKVTPFAPTEEIVQDYIDNDHTDVNNSSIGFLLEAINDGDTYFRGLFPGDMETGAWKTISDIDLSCDLYKAGHHGSENGTPINEMNPLIIEKPYICVATDSRIDPRTHLDIFTQKVFQAWIEEGVSRHGPGVGYIFSTFPFWREENMK